MSLAGRPRSLPDTARSPLAAGTALLQDYHGFASASGPLKRACPRSAGADGFQSINGRLLGFGTKSARNDMLIVCPSCASSYMIDPAAVGPAGRTVRCARCKATWFAGGPKREPDVADIRRQRDRGGRRQTSGAKAQPNAATRQRPLAASRRRFRRRGFPDGHQNRSQSAAFRAAAQSAQPPAEVHASEPEPATIADAPSLVPPIGHEPLPEAGEAAFESEEESFDARRQLLLARRVKSRRSSRWTAIILVLVAFNVALIGARNDVVRYLPQTASLFAAIGLPVNLRGLKFENVKISKETQDGNSILIVQGAIVSEAGKAIEVPRLRFAARNAGGQEVYTWTMPPPRSILGPGERLEFRSQIPAPPADASDVMVRFFSAQDAAAAK